MSTSKGQGRDSGRANNQNESNHRGQRGGQNQKSKDEDTKENGPSIGWAIAGGAVIGGIASILGYLAFNEPQESQQSESTSNSRRAPPEPSNDCSICRDTLLAPLEILPCSHIFHKQCIKDWFKRQMICPVCRHRISDEFISKYNERLGL